MIKNTIDTYGSVTKTLHWLIAVLVVGMVIFGYLLGYIPDNTPLKTTLIGLHKSVGLTILLLIILRICWRFMNIQPLLPITVPPWERLAATGVHAFFYIVLLIMPITGWFMTSFGGHPVMFWGWFNAALPVTKNTDLAKNIFTLHAIVAWVIIALLILHVGAALKHHFIEKNNVLRRMLPGYKSIHLFRE